MHLYIMRALAFGFGCLAATAWVSPAEAAGLKPAKVLNSYGNRDNTNSISTRPKIATDMQGNWLSMWVDAEGRLTFSNSTTSGSAWSSPRTPGLSLGNELTQAAHQADLCYAGAGRWVVVRSPADSKVAVSTDMGYTWTETSSLSTDQTERLNVQVVSDGGGNLLAVWNSVTSTGTGASKVSYYSVKTAASADYGATWTDGREMNLADNRIEAGNPVRIASAGPGRWLMVYSKVVGSDHPGDRGVNIKLAESTDAGATWEDLGNLYNDIINNSSFGEPRFDISVNGSKGFIAAGVPLSFTVAGGSLQYIYRRAVLTSNDAGTSFTGPSWLESDTLTWNADPTDSRLASDGAGNWVLASGSSLEGQVKVWKTPAAGTTWTLATTVADGKSIDPQVAGAGSGNFVILSQHFSYDSTQLFRNENVRSRASADGGANWGSPVLVNDLAKNTTVINDKKVSIAVGPSAMVASWIAISDYSPVVADVSYIMTATSVDGGLTWSDARVAVRNVNTTATLTTFKTGSTFEVYWNDQKAVSTDNGQTWGSPVASGGMPSIGVKDVVTVDNGDLVRVKTDITLVGSAFQFKTYAETSSDGGNTWHGKSEIQTQEKPVVSAFTYQNSAAPEIRYLGNGRVAVMIKNIYGGRIDQLMTYNFKTDVFLAESADNGKTWTTPEAVVSREQGGLFSALPLEGMRFVTSGDRITFAWDDYVQATLEYDIYYRTKLFGEYSSAKDWSLFE